MSESAILEAPALVEFLSPLRGTYDNEYSLDGGGTTTLYELGKSQNWNATTDIDWACPRPEGAPFNESDIGIAGYAPFERLDPAKREAFVWEYLSWHASQFLHGEQGALIVASQLVSCAPDMPSKLYSASQAFDEARHVEVFKRYLQARSLRTYPINRSLNRLISKILSDERWDLKFIGMQVIIESIALASLTNIRKTSRDRLFNDIIGYVIKDESRHVNFGIQFLRDHLARLPQDQLEERARFCFDACVVMRDRFVPVDVYQSLGWPLPDVMRHVASSAYIAGYKDHLYRRLIPVFERIGLITERIAPQYASIGALEYRDYEPILEGAVA